VRCGMSRRRKQAQDCVIIWDKVMLLFPSRHYMIAQT
jgi:hypothetical protein